MIVRRSSTLALTVLTLSTLTLGTVRARADLASYVKAPDPSYAWKAVKDLEVPGGTAVVTRLTSQTWQGIAWEHWLTVIRPEKVTDSEHALLLIAGGSRRNDPPGKISGEGQILARIARETGSVVAVLQQVPNQPLFGDLHEDGLIAHTFVKYMETKDDTWPCLLPMTKSAVRAMDTVQALAKDRFSQDLKSFVVTGASKRGWTTWLTGAVDPRVVAIAPMVIDTLNFPAQMRLQLKSFGTYSEMIGDYTERNLPDQLAQPEGKAIVDLVDPYSYRARLTMPKLILLGTNDPYWPVDALTLYFPDLQGEKNVHYVANGDHGLGPGAVEALAAFYADVISGRPRPRFRWRFERGNPVLSLTVDAEDAPLRAELCRASAPTRDFRKARWTPEPLAGEAAGPGGKRFVGKIEASKDAFGAIFARLYYRSAIGQEYALSTTLEVLEPAAR